MTGRPGDRYWQQWAIYRIAAALRPSGEIVGQESVRYFNRSPDTLTALAVHLYQNLHTLQGAGRSSLSVTGGILLDRVAVNGTALQQIDQLGTAPAYAINATVAWLQLPRPLLPGDSTEVEFQWHFMLPARDPRMGTDHDVYMVGYWYPQFAVYDDVNGWQVDPYRGQAEFYMGYGDYDVTLEVPDGWLVGATGQLLNAADVLSDSILNRVTAVRDSTVVVHVVTSAERGPGRATRPGQSGTRSWHFGAHLVRDFAWVASPSYVWDAVATVLPDSAGQGRLDTVIANALYRPSARAWENADEFAARVLRFYSDHLWPYPYPTLTVAEGPWGGMEYPMFTVLSPYADTVGLFSVEAHEIGHMWFPMQVGSDEKRSPWQDEGLTQFDGDRAFRALAHSARDPELEDVAAYRRAVHERQDAPLRGHGDDFSGGAYAVAAYLKPVAMLRALQGILGDTVFEKALREYGRRWQWRHPQPADFFWTVSNVAGVDLDWFWKDWYLETGLPDQRLGKVVVEGDSLVITVENRGSFPLPVFLLITRADSSWQRVTIPVEVWRNDVRSVSLGVSNLPRVIGVDVDPERWFPNDHPRDGRWRAH